MLIAAVLALLAALPAAAHEGTDAAVLSRPPAPAADAPLVAVSGTVTDLVVEDRVSNRTLRYVALRLDDGQSIPLVGPGLDSLPTGARAEATGRNAGPTLFVTATRLLPEGPRVVAKAAGAPAQVEGTLAMSHSDDFEHGRGRYDLTVIGDNGRATPMKLAVIPDSVRRGMRVIAAGSRAADGFSLDTNNITILALPGASFDQVTALAQTTNNVLVMPIKFTDSPASDSFTPTQIDQVMRTNAGSVAAYYNEVSYGQQLLNITVACLPPMSAGCTANTTAGGWLDAGVVTPAYCDFTLVGEAADAAATAAGYVLSNYKNRYYVTPYNSACGWAGLAYIGYPYQAWSNGYNSLGVYGHELGHNFTLWHAGNLYCPGQVIGGSCSVNEYGDPFDVMGNVRPMHFNSMQKSVLNWIPATSVKTHSSGTATYTLSPIESPGQSTYAVKIPASSTRTYWIEFRQPIGFDAALSSLPNLGAQVRVSGPFDYTCTNCGGDDTEFLDMTPGTSSSSDGTLLAGLSYTDSSKGVNINVLSADTTSMTVQVTMGNATTTTLAGSPNPAALAASVTLTATVSGTSPTGTVNFKDGANSISGCSAIAFLAGSGSTRTAKCLTSTLTAGTHSITATYGGDADDFGSTSPTLSQVVNPAASSTALATSLTPSTVGTSVTFTATVNGSSPTGTVNFKDGATSITGCAAVNLIGGSAQCATSALAVGTRSITAAYGGDANNAGSTSPTLSQVVNPIATATSLATSLTPSTTGTTVTFTATVTGVSPTGTVNFKDGATSITSCSAIALTGTGNARTAKCAIGTLAVGPHSISAAYGGDATNGVSTSAPVSQTVNMASSTTGIVTSLTQAAAGATVTFTATVTGVSPTGTVNFKDGATSIGGCTAIALTGSGNSRTAKCATATLAVGTHGITAAYGGDANNTASTSSALSQVVNKAASTTARSSSPNPAAFAAPVTFTATVTGFNPTGNVNFTDGGSSIAGCDAVALNGTGNTRTAACITSALAAGAHSIVAAYAGDAANTASNSTTLSQTINKAVSTTGVVTSGTPSTVGASVTFTATVSGVSPTGTVSFKDGTNSITGCAAVSLSGGSAQCTTSALAAGVRSIVAKYSGDATNAASSSTTLSQTVNKVASATSNATSLTPSTAGTAVTFTATVSGLSPTGTVNFKDGASSISGCSASAVTGSGNARTAKCAIGTLAVGTHSVTATYNGDASNTSSVSSALSQVVNQATSTSALVTSLTPSTGGATVTFTATVGGSGPTGTVNFKDGADSIGGCTAIALTGSGNSRTAKCATATLAVGTHGITAAYGGDANNTASTSSALSQVVNKAASTTARSSSPNPAAFAAPVTFTATVTGFNPTGTVNFTDGGSSIAGCDAVALNGTGNTRTAACITSALAAGAHSIVAAYAGDAANTASNSTTLSQTINKAVSTTGVVTSGTPSTVGASVTFTATVSGVSPTGTVSFKDGSNLISGCSPVNLSGGSAQCLTSALTMGTHNITAVYGGDATNVGSTSAVLSQAIN